MPTEAAWYAEAERRLGRPLTAAELRIDARDAVDQMEAGKERLRRAIEAEKRRAIRRWLDHGHTHLNVSRAIDDALGTVYHAGRRHALQEARLMGVTDMRSHFAEGDPWWRRLRAKVATGLAVLARRVDQEAVRVTLGGVPEAVVSRIDRAAPGALDLASRLVSTAYTSGLSDVYQANEGLFDGWQYTAVLDGGTCDECEARDGEEYETLDAGLEVLPDFGPNPDCYGEDRCRCRLVPIGPA